MIADVHSLATETRLSTSVVCRALDLRKYLEARMVYLAILADLRMRAIMGWATSRLCDAAEERQCIDVAISRHSAGRDMIVHSDQGSKYTTGE